MRTLGKISNIRNWPIAIKLSVIYSILFSITIPIITLSSFQIYRNSMEQQTKEYIPQILNNTNFNIENYVSDLISVAQMPTIAPYSAAITDVIRSESSMAQRTSLSHSIRMFRSLNFVNSFQTNLRGVTVYTNYGYAYTRLIDIGGIWEHKPYQNQSWYDEEEPITKLKVVGATRDSNGEGLVYTLVQPIIPLGSARSYGYFEVSGSLKRVGDLAQTIDFGPNAKLFIMDHQNTILYSTGSEARTGTIWERHFGFDWNTTLGHQGSNVITMDGNQYLLSYYQSGKTQWKIVALIPMENLSQGVERVRTMMVLWISLGTFLVCLISVNVSVTITNPLRHLTRQLDRMESNNFAVHLKKVRMDEVGRLAEGLRKMGKRINILINEVYKSMLLKQEAEIHVLQSQINPHFMNNVLETIRMMNKTGKQEQVDEGLTLFGELTRYHTKQSNEMVTLGTELEFIHNYLKLQKLRFGDQLEMMIDVQPEVLHCYIPNLLIQPILENAINHGQSPYDQHLRIILKIYEENSFIVISIVDEGPGMSEEKLEQLHFILESGHSEKKRIGLLNVYQRIQLIYKQEGTLFIHSEEGLGTKLVIKVPKRI